jgi:hypothetical protein
MPTAKLSRLATGPNQVVNAPVVGSWAAENAQAFQATDFQLAIDLLHHPILRYGRT